MRIVFPLLAAGALAATAIWWIVALWQFTHPQLGPSLLADTAPLLVAFLLGLLLLVVGALAVLVRTYGRRGALGLALVGLLAAAGPVWVVVDTFATLNDWNFPNRTFLAAYLPAVAFVLDRSLPRVDRRPHYVIHHAHPLPNWEVADLERQWKRLRRLTGSEPRAGITLYLNDADVGALGLAHHGAAYGPLAIARPLTLVDVCDGGVLHEVAHTFMYVQSKGNTFPQLLDEGWAVANQGCPERTLDQKVETDLQEGLMPPLEDRLTESGFQNARYGGTTTAYDAGGSFVAWLLARYRPQQFMAWINSATVTNFTARAEAVYGVSLPRLERLWLAHIAHELGVPALTFSPNV